MCYVNSACVRVFNEDTWVPMIEFKSAQIFRFFQLANFIVDADLMLSRPHANVDFCWKGVES